MPRWIGRIATTLLLLASGCATAYGPRGLTGGYSEVPLDASTFRVEFNGNGFTPREKVEAFLHYRCAEVVVDNGFDWFVVLKGETAANDQSYTAPGTVTANATTVGRSTWVTGRYTPGQTYSWTKYGAIAVVKAFRGQKPDAGPLAFDAREVLSILGPAIGQRHAEIARSATPIPGAPVQRARAEAPEEPRLQESVSLRLITDPAGAEVYVRGLLMGVTSAKGLLLDVEPGTLACEIRKAGYLVMTRSVQVERGPNQVLYVQLTAGAR